MTATRAIAAIMTMLVSLLLTGCTGSDKAASEGAGKPEPTAPSDPSGEYEGRPPELVQVWVDAIESCSTRNVEGTYEGCLDRDALLRDEPRLADAPGTTTISTGPDPERSYEVVVKLDDTVFTYTKDDTTGDVTQTCRPPAAPVCSAGT